jgi:protein ImuB
VSFTAIHIAEFPATAWRRACPGLGSEPLVVVEGVPPQEKVVSLSESAKAIGIEHGMSKVQAEAGGSFCCRARQIDEETQAFAEAVEIADRFSPRIESIASPANAYAAGRHLSASLLIDSSGIGTLFGTDENYARRLHKELTVAGFPTGIGSATNAEAALLLARSSRSVVCADTTSLRAKLALLPVSLLPCEPKMLGVLSRWGIRSLGQVAALPETALISRLGQAGQRLQQLARGEAEHLLVPEEPAFTLAETAALDSPLELLDSLLFVLSPMLDAMMRQAVGRACALRTVRMTLRLERGEQHVLTVSPATPTQNREVLVKLINLELQAHPPQSGILMVTLEAEPARPQTSQRGLFRAQFPEPDKLELLLARLRAIAGEQNVGSPRLLNSARSDAFTLAPFQPSLRTASAVDLLPTRLALRVFRPPQPVRVVSSSDHPQTLFWQSVRYAVVSAAGPWHSSGSWWDRQTWDVDLWDVVTAAPVQALRLQQERASKSWTVVGIYD